MKAYLLVYDKGVDHQALREVLDYHPDVKNWFKAFPNSYFIISDLNASDQLKVFKSAMKGANFLITKIDTDPTKTNGLMSSEDWDFILHPSEG